MLLFLLSRMNVTNTFPVSIITLPFPIYYCGEADYRRARAFDTLLGGC
jgi:hypothetical protein